MKNYFSLQHLEQLLFRLRVPILGALAALTAVMAFFALQLRMDAGFEKQMPVGHEYIQTFNQYRNEVLGANRLNIVLRARQGQIWTQPGLARLYALTQAVMFLPNIDRLGVQSLWTPNTFVNEITEEGFRADPVIPGTVTPERLDAAALAQIRQSTAAGGFVGTLVSQRQDSAMVIAEINEFDAQGHKIDYVAYNHLLEQQIRAKFEDKDFEVQIIGFAKQIGDVADGAAGVVKFCIIALVLTALAVYWYCRSVPLDPVAGRCVRWYRWCGSSAPCACSATASIRWPCWCRSWCSPSACRTACSRSITSCAASPPAWTAHRPPGPASAACWCRACWRW